MLRRVRNVGLDHQPGSFTGRGWVVLQVGRSRHRGAKGPSPGPWWINFDATA